jgi:hypothetical protein
MHSNQDHVQVPDGKTRKQLFKFSPLHTSDSTPYTLKLARLNEQAMADKLPPNTLSRANMLTSKAGPCCGRETNTQDTQSIKTVQQNSMEPPTPLTATRKRCCS